MRLLVRLVPSGTEPWLGSRGLPVLIGEEQPESGGGGTMSTWGLIEKGQRSFKIRALSTNLQRNLAAEKASNKRLKRIFCF